MAGPVSVRQLMRPMSARSVEFAVAEPKHDAAIRRLLRENPMTGAIRLTLEREPAYFASVGIAQAREQTILALAGEHALCMGRCTERPCWVDGGVRRVGYLSELRLDYTVRGRSEILRRGYRFFHEQQRAAPADLYFSSIAADNDHARRLLERGVPGLPSYRLVANYVTRVIPVPRARPAIPSDIRHRAATLGDMPAIVAFLNEHAARHALAAHWTEAGLASLAIHGLPLNRFHLLSAGDRLLACAALWDQRSFRQTVVRGYAPVLRLARPWLNVFARATGQIALPPIGAPLPHAFVSPIATIEDRPELVLELLDRLAPDAVRLGIQLLTLGFADSDPRLTVLRQKGSGREYRTRFYQVIWPGDLDGHCLMDGRRVLPEIALL